MEERCVSVVQEGIKSRDRFVYRLLVTEHGECSENISSRHRIQMTLALFWVPTEVPVRKLQGKQVWFWSLQASLSE